MTDFTKAQLMMIEDGFPASLFIDQETRRQAWKGVKLTKPRETIERRQTEDPGTIKLLADRAAAQRAAEKKKKADRREAAIIRAKQKGIPSTTKQESTMTTKTSKTDQVAALRVSRANKKGPKAAKKAASKKSATAKARTPAKVKTDAPKGVRPGSKLEIVVNLLKRKEGCTAAEVLTATEWPAVSMPQQARAAGLMLRKEKDGKVTRYYAA